MTLRASLVFAHVSSNLEPLRENYRSSNTQVQRQMDIESILIMNSFRISTAPPINFFFLKSTTPSVQSRGRDENAGSQTTSGSSSRELESFVFVHRRLSPTKWFGATTRDRTFSTPSYSRSILS